MQGNLMTWGAIVLGILVAVNQWLDWGNLQYLWAVLVIALGVWGMMKK